MSRTLYVLRHGETAWNAQFRMQGHRDSPLTLRGLEMAHAVGRLMRDLVGPDDGFDIVSSPIVRAWQTAAIVAETMGRGIDGIARDDRLKEVAFGDWEGLTHEQIDDYGPGTWQTYVDNRWTQAAPGGETGAQLYDRVADWLAEQPADAKRIVVCHGGTSRVLRGAYLGLDPETIIHLPIKHTQVFRLQDGAETPYDAREAVDA